MLGYSVLLLYLCNLPNNHAMYVMHKILHIHINEYPSHSALSLAYAEVTKDIKRCTICGSKKNAVILLMNKDNDYGRIFWWKMTKFEGTEYFQLYETIFD